MGKEYFASAQLGKSQAIHTWAWRKVCLCSICPLKQEYPFLAKTNPDEESLLHTDSGLAKVTSDCPEEPMFFAPHIRLVLEDWPSVKTDPFYLLHHCFKDVQDAVQLRSWALQPITSLACCPSGTYLAGGSERGHIFVWATATGELLHSWAAHYRVHPSLRLAFPPLSKVLSN